MDKKQQIGITETGDAFNNLEIFDNLCAANIIVTKRLTTKLIDKLIENKEKCILHLTVTGMGSSRLEPMVPTKEQSFKKFNELIEKGFPVKQVVLRIDPIIPTAKGIITATTVIKLFINSGITRIRYSSMDMYNHVKERFNEESIPLPYNTFHAKLSDIKNLDDKMKACGILMDADIEACGEPGVETIGCISQKDINILGLTDQITLVGNADQRNGCKCPSNKHQLIKAKPSPCSNACLYCFWRD